MLNKNNAQCEKKNLCLIQNENINKQTKTRQNWAVSCDDVLDDFGWFVFYVVNFWYTSEGADVIFETMKCVCVFWAK